MMSCYLGDASGVASNLNQGSTLKQAQRKRRLDTDESINSDCSDVGDNVLDKIEMNRERNREHARRTRLRKKAHLQTLRERVIQLESEAASIEDVLDKIRMANILIEMSTMSTTRLSDPESTRTVREDKQVCSAGSSHGGAAVLSSFSAGSGSADDSSEAGSYDTLIEERSPRDEPHQPSGYRPNGSVTGAPLGSGVGRQGPAALSGQTVNWKEGYVVGPEGTRTALSSADLNRLRRERNRMHAKMTRDRKRELISGLEQRIAELETKNRFRRESINRSLKESLPSDIVANMASRLGVGTSSAHQHARPCLR